jgi:hypothetical protein
MSSIKRRKKTGLKTSERRAFIVVGVGHSSCHHDLGAEPDDGRNSVNTSHCGRQVQVLHRN